MIERFRSFTLKPLLFPCLSSREAYSPQFAAHHGLKYQTFATWLQKRKRATGAYPELAVTGHHPPLLLAEVETPRLTEEDAATPLEIRLSGGAVLLLSNSSQLPIVVALLRGLSTSRSC